MISYCPHCWAENVYKASICADCGASLDERGKSYVDMLIDAISHSEPTRAVIAIEIVGCRLREARAVDALLARLGRNPDSMDVTTAAAKALGLIREQQAVPGLAVLLLDDGRPLPARLAAVEALGALGGPAACEALAATMALPQLPRLLRRVTESAQRRASEQ